MASVTLGRWTWGHRRSLVKPEEPAHSGWVLGEARPTHFGSPSPSLLCLCSMPQDLSEALKEATKEVHTQAENAEFMKNFQKGQVTEEGFKVCVLGER